MGAAEDLDPDPKIQPLPQQATPAERLEMELGGDLTRFLLIALASTQPPLRGDPR